MYQIMADDMLIYDPRIPELSLSKSNLKLEVNTSGLLTFTMPKTHPYYGMVNLMKSRIRIFDDDVLVFDGRPYSPAIDYFENGTMECEGIMAFLNDTYQEPIDYFGDVLTLFTTVIERHNSQVSADKQFKIGEVSVTSDTDTGYIVRSSDYYMNTWEFMKDKFIGSSLGGYLVARSEADGLYIDYVEDYNYLGTQEIAQCINILDADKKLSVETLATVVVPLGARIENEYGEQGDFLTIADVNSGRIYLEDQQGVSLYGKIARIVEHPDITDAANLKRAGQKDLADFCRVVTSVKVKAVDLAKAGFAVTPFSLGNYVETNIDNLDIHQRMLIKSLSIDMLNSAQNSITLGAIGDSLTGFSVSTAQSISNIRNDLIKQVRASREAVKTDLRRETEVSLENTSEQIMTRVAENYYNQAQSDALYSSLSTQMEQTAQAIEFTFNSFKTEQQIVNGNTVDVFEEWRKYIRFIGGNILLGVEGNPLILRLQNDRIEFLEDNNVIAYWQNRKFYAVDGEFINSLQLGKFAFFPRTSGNLSFFKIED